MPDVVVAGSAVEGTSVVGSTVVGSSVIGSTVVGAVVVGSSVIGSVVVGSVVIGATVVETTEFPSSQSTYVFTLVYTPGRSGRVQPIPRDTTPASFLLQIKEPPLSVWHEALPCKKSKNITLFSGLFMTENVIFCVKIKILEQVYKGGFYKQSQ